MTRASWIPAIALVTIVAGITARPAFAQDEAFKAGMQARDRDAPDWKQVEAQMRKAIAANPTDSDRRVGSRLGFGGNPYVPHFYLGEALFRQGLCAEALTHWETFDRAGVAVDRKELRQTIQTGYQQCEAKGVLPAVRLGPAIKSAEDAIANANRAAQRVSAFSDANVAVWRANPELGTRNLGAGRELDQAGIRLTAGKSSRLLQDLTDARALADSAARTFGDLLAAAEKSVKSLEGRGAALDRALETATASADKLGQEIDQAAAPPLRLTNQDVTDEYLRARQVLDRARGRLAAGRSARTLDDAETDIREAEKIIAGTTALLGKLKSDVSARVLKELADSAPAKFEAAKATLDALTQAIRDKPPAEDQRPKIERDLQSATRTLANAPRLLKEAIERSDLTGALSAFGAAAAVERRLANYASLMVGPANPFEAPEAVRTGAQLFFDARYQDAIGALTDELAASSGRHAVHVHTLRAAALFALHEYGGRKDDALLARARADAQKARALDPAFTPNPAAFSPRFIAFFQGSDR